MSNLRLYIGNYNYSSWSLRAWQILRKTELPFETVMVDLDAELAPYDGSFGIQFH